MVDICLVFNDLLPAYSKEIVRTDDICIYTCYTHIFWAICFTHNTGSLSMWIAFYYMQCMWRRPIEKGYKKMYRKHTTSSITAISIICKDHFWKVLRNDVNMTHKISSVHQSRSFKSLYVKCSRASWLPKLSFTLHDKIDETFDGMTWITFHQSCH